MPGAVAPNSADYRGERRPPTVRGVRRRTTRTNILGTTMGYFIRFVTASMTFASTFWAAATIFDESVVEFVDFVFGRAGRSPTCSSQLPNVTWTPLLPSASLTSSV